MRNHPTKEITLKEFLSMPFYNIHFFIYLDDFMRMYIIWDDNTAGKKNFEKTIEPFLNRKIKSVEFHNDNLYDMPVAHIAI